MRIPHFLLVLAAAGLAAACEDEQQTAGSEQLRWTTQEQVHRENGTATAPRPAVGPEQRLRQFFEAVQSGQPQQAAALVSQTPREVSQAELVESLRQWAGEPVAQQGFEVIDSRQAGDFALVRARFMSPDNTQTQPLLRPVVLFREQGEWKVVWDLIGMLPEQVAQVDPQVAEQLDPLYRWYAQQQRTHIGEAGEERPGGSPATDEALGRQSGQQPGGGSPRG